MTDCEKDSITHLNTQLNKSMVLMENIVDTPPEHPRHSKSIKINTTAQPRSATSSPAVKSRKSILKKSDRSFSEKSTDKEITQMNGNVESISDLSQRLVTAPNTTRPRNLRELIERETLVVESSESFSLNDISDNEEIWIMDIPKSIDPKELHGQKITLGDKSKIKIKGERYCTTAHNFKCNITCVLSTGKEEPLYKTVNIKPAGLLTVRRKLSVASKMKPISSDKNSSIPLFPNELKIRHPLLGINYDSKVRKKSKKRHSIKKKK
ncbi:uncharacterized protein LOC116840581 [Odontomachus brunneus]|uniref:uncharacterized protein LOC116840581 n=1 Tax=Odontomachus brunneus TaxID=486640 RepID=UPI0013F19EEC|nr:uncharacterized protein LOC116840581 [Odontomachus brunneus]